MNYRLIVRWGATEEITEQYFSSFGDADTVIDYLKRALENGARVSWILQKKQKNEQAVALDSYDQVGDWEYISWMAN